MEAGGVGGLLSDGESYPDYVLLFTNRRGH